MICSSCGNEVMDNMKFCPSCGTPVAQQQVVQNVNQPSAVEQPAYQQSSLQQEIPQPVQQPEYQQSTVQQPIQQPSGFQQPQYQQPMNNQNFGGNIPQNNYTQQYYPPNSFQTAPQAQPKSGAKGTAAIVLAIIGFVGNLFIAILGWIFGGIALCLALSARSNNHQDSKAKVGLIFAIITLVASLINSALGIILSMSSML